jgi:hypothetical protein
VVSESDSDCANGEKTLQLRPDDAIIIEIAASIGDIQVVITGCEINEAIMMKV